MRLSGGRARHALRRSGIVGRDGITSHCRCAGFQSEPLRPRRRQFFPCCRIGWLWPLRRRLSRRPEMDANRYRVGSHCGGVAGLLSQLPGGELLDKVRSKRTVIAIGACVVILSALILAFWPRLPSVFIALVLQGATGGFLGPAIAAISLGLVGHAALAERLGRNQRFASTGALAGAALIGVVGYLMSYQAIFLIVALLGLPLFVSLARIRAAISLRQILWWDAIRMPTSSSARGGNSNSCAPDLAALSATFAERSKTMPHGRRRRGIRPRLSLGLCQAHAQ